MCIDYLASIEETRHNILRYMVEGLEGVPALQEFENGVDNGYLDWEKGERWYDSVEEQALSYGYGALENIGEAWLVVEVPFIV